MLNLFWSMVYLVFVNLILHELGHYAAAKRAGMRKIKFKIFPKWYYPAAISYETDLETREDLHKIVFVQASGSMWTIVGILFAAILDFWSVEYCFLMTIFNVLYMFWEITHTE